jgi:uncharacterized protein (TIGR01619 family)
MTNNWDFYAVRVDNKLASIMVDLGIEAEAPITSLPYAATIRLYLKHASPLGMSSDAEFDILSNIENTLEEALCNTSVAYVGRNTCDGYRDFYFYISQNEKWHERVVVALSTFIDYEDESGVREDSEWSTYFNFLLPRRIDKQRIQNRRVCEQLEKHGDALQYSRELDHWIIFPTPLALDNFLQEVSKVGFHLRGRTTHEGEVLVHGVHIFRQDTPSYDNIDEVVLSVFDIATKYEGKYDGWECAVVR